MIVNLKKEQVIGSDRVDGTQLHSFRFESLVFEESASVSLVSQIQQVAGRHLSEPQRYCQGPEGSGGDVIGAGAHGQQPVQQRRA